MGNRDLVLFKLNSFKSLQTSAYRLLYSVGHVSFFSFLLMFVFTWSPVSHAGDKRLLSYTGRILNPDSSPLQSSSVTFSFQILAPSGCVLWQETLSAVNMSGSNGIVDLKVGAGANAAAGGLTWTQVFQNGVAFSSLTGTGCGGGTYTGAATDDRTLYMTFNDGSGSNTVGPMSLLSLSQNAMLAGYPLYGSPTNGQMLTFDSTNSYWYPSTVGGSGTVTSVNVALAASLSSIISASGGPVTTAGSITLSASNQTANTVFAGPSSGGAAAPTFRALVAADIPSIDAAKITTGVVPIGSGGTNSSTALSNNRIMVSSSGAIVEASALTNGQLLIGSSGAAPVAATITGTSNQVSVATGAGSITLSTPQNIHTGASPTFTGLTLSGMSSAGLVKNSAAGVLSGGGTLATTDMPTYATNSVMTTNSSGVLTASAGSSTGQLLAMNAGSPAWSTATYPLTTTVSQLLYSSSSNVVAGLATANSSVLITNGSGVPAWSTLTTDNFSQYALLAGRSGGQSLTGGTGSGENVTINSTTHATKGYVLLNTGGGNVGIGTSSPGQALEVNGSVKATAYISTSDRRLKTNIESLQGSLDKIKQLRGVSFDWKKDGQHEIGLIAQEVEEIYPDLVVTDSITGLKAVKYSSLVSPLIEATKELSVRCEMSQKQMDEISLQMARHLQVVERKLANIENENKELHNLVKSLEQRVKTIEAGQK